MLSPRHTLHPTHVSFLLPLSNPHSPQECLQGAALCMSISLYKLQRMRCLLLSCCSATILFASARNALSFHRPKRAKLYRALLFVLKQLCFSLGKQIWSRQTWNARLHGLRLHCVKAKMVSSYFGLHSIGRTAPLRFFTFAHPSTPFSFLTRTKSPSSPGSWRSWRSWRN